MINEKAIQKYICCEDIRLIENYDKAINDNDVTWHCHHRLEIQNDCVVTVKELKERNLYFNRPASELIFLSPSEHHKLHSNNFTDDMIKSMSKPKRNKIKSLKKDREFKCPYCGKTFIIQMSDKVFEKHWGGKKLEKCCSQKCAQKLVQSKRDNSIYQTEEHRLKLKESWLKRKEKGLSSSNTGKTWKWSKGGHTEEEKRKISEAAKRRWEMEKC